MPDLESQKVAFRMLSAKERHYIWYNKIKKAVNSPEKYNKEQLSLLQDFLNNLNEDLYEESREDKRAIFENIYLKEWNDKANGIFDDTQIYDILLTMNSLDYDIKHGLIQGSKNDIDITKKAKTKLVECICNKGSRMTCWRMRSITLQGPTIEYGLCSSYGDCDGSTFGCGMLMIFNCNAGYCTWS